MGREPSVRYGWKAESPAGGVVPSVGMGVEGASIWEVQALKRRSP